MRIFDLPLFLSARNVRMCNRRCLRSSRIGMLCTAFSVPSQTIQTVLRCPRLESSAFIPHWNDYILDFVVDLVEERFDLGGSQFSEPILGRWYSAHASQQNVVALEFGSPCSPRSALFAHDSNRHDQQRVSPFFHEVFHLQRWTLRFHEQNVFENSLTHFLHLFQQRVSSFFNVLFQRWNRSNPVLGFPPFYSCDTWTWHRYWMGIHPTSRERVSLSLDTVVVGEADELEEDVKQCLSCFENVTEVEEKQKKNSLTSLELRSERSSPYYIEFEVRFEWDVIFDRWSIRKSIRVHRKAFQATILLACFRKLSQSRIYPILWHTPLSFHAFALLHWRLWLS